MWCIITTLFFFYNCILLIFSAVIVCPGAVWLLCVSNLLWRDSRRPIHGVWTASRFYSHGVHLTQCHAETAADSKSCHVTEYTLPNVMQKLLLIVSCKHWKIFYFPLRAVIVISYVHNAWVKIIDCAILLSKLRNNSAIVLTIQFAKYENISVWELLFRIPYMGWLIYLCIYTFISVLFVCLHIGI